MKNLFLILSLLSTLGLFAQKKVHFSELDNNRGLIFQRNHMEPFTGTAYDEYGNGNKKGEIPFKKGKIEGKAMEWHLNGKKMSEVYYVDNKRQGMEQTWYKNGQLKTTVTYENDLIEGEAFEFYASGELMSKGDFINGKEEGKHVWYFENGQIDQEVPFKNGLENGMITRYHKDGAKKLESPYVNGKKEGTSIEWHKNGKKESSASYKEGVQIGDAFTWDSRGKLLGKKVFENGELVKELNYRNATLRSKKGQIQVFNEMDATHYYIEIIGGRVRPIPAKQLTFKVDDRLLQLMNVPIKEFSSMPAAEDHLMAHQKYEINLLKEGGTEGDLTKMKSETIRAKNGQQALYWSYPVQSQKVSPKGRRMVGEHYISMICGTQVLVLYAPLMDTDKPEDLKKWLKAHADEVVITEAPIDLNEMVRKIQGK